MFNRIGQLNSFEFNSKELKILSYKYLLLKKDDKFCKKKGDKYLYGFPSNKNKIFISLS